MPATSPTVSATANDGFFVDDVTITNATELVNATVTSLPGSATTFTLDGSTAGAPLVAGTSYYLRIRPNVGTRWFDYGATKTVTPQAATGYAAWVAQYPTVTEGPTGDHERDGLANGVEYAFGLNPTTPTPASAVPQPTRVGSNFSVTFNQPAGVTGVTYGAQTSTDLLTWSPVTDTGSGSVHTFSTSTVGQSKLFFRYVITVAQ